MQRFILLGLPRSGTTFLATLLNSHSKIHCAGELFNPYRVIDLGPDDSDASVFNRDAQPVKFTNAFYDRLASEKFAAGGFKLMIGHNVNVLKWISENPDIRIIFIRRHNKLAQIASWIKAAQSQEWVKTTRSDVRKAVVEKTPLGLGRFFAAKTNRPPAQNHSFDDAGRLTVGPRRISQGWHEFSTFDYLVSHWLESVPNKVLRVDYKAVVQPDTQKRICQFLGVKPQSDMSTPLQKQGVNKVIDRFVHTDQITQYFTRRGLAHWLGDELSEDVANSKSDTD